MLAGPNGAGKTNVLEALSLLGPGRGLRRAPLRELNSEWGGSFALHGAFETPDGPVEVGTAFDAESGRRLVHLDGAALAGPAALTGVTGSVWLTPPMDRLFTEGTAARRRLLDRLVCAGDSARARALARYEHLLRERGRVLRSRSADPVWLSSLEEQAAAAGVAVAAARLEVLADLNRRLLDAETSFPRARLGVVGEIERALDERPALDVEEHLTRCFAASRADDAATGGARHGPHRSDLEVVDIELASPAAKLSTGRQKALLIGLVLAEARLYLERNGHLPLVLLDEVGAHLDRDRRHQLCCEVSALGAQAWLTATEVDGFEPLRGAAQFLRVDQARVLLDV